MARDLERLFDRYRRKGDTKALARIFDRTGHDLLRLAQHLVSDMGEAEDLVQTTFVTAIDRAQSYDKSQPLRPWLAGILAHHAANWNRRAQTRRSHQESNETDQLPARAAAWSPLRQACQAELEGTVENALQRMSPRYRRVLQPYLLHTQKPEQIARTLGEAPGTVRTQIHRGLERLRRILPAGALVGYVGTTRGWGAVRSSVLSHAQLSAGGAALATSALAPTLIGGLIVTQKAVVAGSVALVASLAWVAWPEGESPEPPVLNQEVVETRVAAKSASDPLTPAASLTPVAGTPQASAPDQILAPQVEADREAITQGKAVLKGQLVGVEPRHFEGLQFQLSQFARKPAGVAGADFELDVAMLSGLPIVNGVQEQGYYRDSLGAADGSQGKRYTSEYRTQRTYKLPLPDVTIDADGSFAIELSELIPVDGQEWVLEASHEVYADSQAPFRFAADVVTRLEQGEVCTAETTLEFTPLAVLQGKIEQQGEQTFFISYGLPAGEHETGADGSFDTTVVDTLEGRLMPIRTALIAPDDATASPQGGEGSESVEEPNPVEELERLEVLQQQLQEEAISFLLTSQSVRVGLFRYGETEFVAEGFCGLDGAFTLRTPEEGNFLLVAMQDGFPILSVPVELTLREVTQTEEDLKIPQGVELKGQVNDFGLFPEGGLRLRAVRTDLVAPKTFIWGDLQVLAWDGQQVVRGQLSGETEAKGRFQFEAAAPGAYRISIHHPGMLAVFTEEELADSYNEVKAPSQQAFLTLPASIIELNVVLPAGAQEPDEEQGEPDWHLVLEDISSGPSKPRSLGQVKIARNDRMPLLVRPESQLRLILVDPQDANTVVWQGKSGPMGSWDRVELPLEIPKSDPVE